MKQSPMDNAIANHDSLVRNANSRAMGTWFFLLLIAASAIIAHGQCVTYRFLPYDDHLFVLNNPVVVKGLTLEGLRYAFTDVGSDVNWVPMARISHMLDVQIYGLRPWGHHLTNLLLHTANACLFFMLLLQLTGARWQAAIAAILFAVHPVHVESVAWIAERRDVLSLFFGLLAMMAYLRYVRCVLASTRWPGAGWYLLVCFCILLSVMGKPSMVTLPCVLWLLDFWPLRRFETIWRSHARLWGIGLVVFEKLPWFGLVSISMWFTMQAQTKTIMPVSMLPWSQRLVRVPLAYVDYLKILFWPVNLSPLYWDRFTWTEVGAAISVGVMLLITYVAVRNWKRRPALLTGWLWYLGTMVPMIGLVPVGFQTHACRYAYFPFLGLYVILAWALGWWLTQQRTIKARNLGDRVSGCVDLYAGGWNLASKSRLDKL